MADKEIKIEIEKEKSSTLSEELKQNIINGFKINHMKMKDGDTSIVLWESFNWDFNHKNEYLPKELLNCTVVNREINFSSKEEIEDLRLIQNFYVYGELIEVSKFAFGFVIPNSTNNWEQYITSKSPEEMIPYDKLSGNLVVETIFYSGDAVFLRNRVRIFYK